MFAIAVASVAILPLNAGAIPNPASVFCGTMGGRSVMAKLPDGGVIGLCYLPNKKIVEEWTLFRMLKGKKPPQHRNPFR